MPPATLVGPSAMHPWAVPLTLVEHMPGVAVCHRNFPVVGSSAAQEPLFTEVLDGWSEYVTLRELEIGT